MKLAAIFIISIISGCALNPEQARIAAEKEKQRVAEVEIACAADETKCSHYQQNNSDEPAVSNNTLLWRLLLKPAH
jgi:hypothetical protein